MDEWKKLEEAVHELSSEVFYNYYGIAYSDDEGKEYRPENIKIALAFLPMFKDVCGSVYPVPSVRTFPEGWVEFLWMKRDPLRRVKCCISAEEKIVDVSKYTGQVKPFGQGDKAGTYLDWTDTGYGLFAFTLEDQSNKGKIEETLQSFLKDVFTLE